MTNLTPKTNNKMERYSPKYSGKKRSPVGQRASASVTLKSPPIYIPTRTKNNINNNSESTSPQSGGRSPNNMARMTPKSQNNAKNQSPDASLAKKRSYHQSPTALLSRNESPRSSPTNSSPTNGSFYAGAKFSEPPSPASLPKPPLHWTADIVSNCRQATTSCTFGNHLKMILNVQA